MSGGLDSTFAAYLLKEKGHDVEAAVVLMHGYTDTNPAETACARLGIPLHVIDAKKAFDEKVVCPFVEAYCEGKTPNPCVECNPNVKIGALIDYAEKNGFDAVATGHYANIGKESGRYFIETAADMKKDQSYVLWKLDQNILSKLILPLGNYTKKEIRDEAGELGFESAKAEESQEICFIPDNDHAAFIRRRTGKSFEEGDFTDEYGNVLGRHKGIINYTIGQRKGLGIALGQPMFVSEIDAAENTVTLVESGKEYFTSARITDLVFQKTKKKTDGEIIAVCRPRYSSKFVPCKVVFDENGAEVRFIEPARAVTKGQSLVVYEDGGILFGGIIENAEPIYR